MKKCVPDLHKYLKSAILQVHYKIADTLNLINCSESIETKAIH